MNEVIFTNGIIYIDAVRKVKSLIVKDGSVQAYDVDPSQYKNAEIIDLKGGAVYPGFCDSHVHPAEVGAFLSGVPLRNCVTSDDIAKAVSGFLEKRPKNSPILGIGFYPKDYDAWSLGDLAKIDKVTGSAPAMLVDLLGHNCVVNSTAMSKCNITAKTPLPMGGKIILEDGKPTGMLRESAMVLAGNTIIPLSSEDIVKESAKKILDLWSSMGYTAIVDLMGGPFGRMMKPNILWDLEKEGKLPVRVNYMYTFFTLDEIDNAMKYVDKNTDMVRFGGLKLFVDGAYAGGQAWTTWKNLQGGKGLSYVYTDDSYGEQYNINRIVEKVNDLGLNIHYHMQGDKAIGSVLDALDAALKKKGKLTSTHTFIHLAFPTEEQIARMKKFEPHVVATVQPGFWQIEEESVRYYGEKAKSCYPIKKLIDTGISTGMGTDFSVSPLELCAPTTIMGVSMAGGGDPKNHKPLSMKQLIHGFTVGSTATTLRKDVGVLDVGYKADFVVYDKDLYSVPKENFNKDNPKVLSTWIGGRKVYEV